MPVVPQAQKQETLQPIQGGGNLPKPRDLGYGQATEKALGIVGRAQEDAYQVAMLNIRNKVSELETELLYNRDTGALNTKSGNALGVTTDTIAAFNKNVQGLEKELSDDRQKQALKQYALTRQDAINKVLNKHEAGQLTIFDDEQTKSMISNEKIKAGRNHLDNDEINMSILTQQAAIGDYATRHGKSADWIKSEKTLIASETHKEVINQMLSSGNDALALDYYNKVMKEKTLIDKGGKIGVLVNRSNELAEGNRLADTIWDEVGPEDDEEAVDLDDMVGKIKTDSEEVKSIAKTSLKERKGIHDASVKERHDANSSSVWRALAEGSLYSEVIAMPEYIALRGEEQIQVKRYVDSGGQSKQPSNNQWGKYWDYANDPDRLVGMTPDEIETLVPTIGRKLTNNLQQMKVSMGKIDLSSVKLTDKTFKEIAVAAGIDPFNKDSKVRVAQIHEFVMGILSEAQQDKGRPLTYDEKKNIMQSEIDNQVIINTGLFSKKAVPLFTLSEEEKAKVNVPQKMRLDIEKALRARGIRVSDDIIKQYYIEYIGSK
jgi:hypothetical protein